MLTFNTNSLHYQLALLGGLSKYNDDSNICEYTRHVLFGSLFAIVIGLIIAFIGMVLSHMLFAIGFSLVYGILIFTDPAIAGFITTSIGLFWFGMWKLTESAKEHRRNAPDEPKKPDGFVKHAYKSWKEKYCVKVEFTNRPVESGWDGS
jgi:hypothetical protein